MRLFIDESLSPSIAIRLNETGAYDAARPLHVGRRQERDDTVFARCLMEGRVLVTQNARDFRGLVARADLHPGLIILPGLDRQGTWTLLHAALAWLAGQGDPMDLMVNHVLEAAKNGRMTFYPSPSES